MAVSRRLCVAITIAVAVCGALAYLHDPPWLISVTSGMRPWEIDASGHRLRWSGGHASFFVPSDARLVSIPLRTSFDKDDPPVTATITLDDRLVDRIVLRDAEWHISTFRLPPRGSRRVHRVDIRVDRTRDDNRGAAIGEIATR